MIRVGIAGAGLMGRWHAYYARRCGASIVGVADPARPAAELQQHFRGAAVFKDAGPLIEALKPDVLHVCTPAATHEQIIETALDAGVHLLVEKPLALTATTTERLVAKAAERRVLLAPVHQYVFQDGVVRAAGWLPQIGTPLDFDAAICSAGGSYLRGEQLDDLAADILPHPLALLDTLFPGALAAIEWMQVRTRSGEWRILGAVADRGVSVSILISLHGRPTQSSLRITGANGTIHMDLFHGFAVLEPGGVSRAHKIARPFTLAARTFQAATWNLAGRLIRREPAYPGLRRLIGRFYDAVHEHAELPFSDEHIVAVANAREHLRGMVTPTRESHSLSVKSIASNEFFVFSAGKRTGFDQNHGE
jgi:predicted dehydrogenase